MSTGRPRPWHNPTPLPGFEPEWAGQFDTFSDWVDYATKALTGELGTVGNELSPFCVDTKGRRCSCGADFMRARDEDAFPVRYFWTGKIIDLPADERLDEIRRTRDIAQQSLRVIPDEMKHIVQSLDAIPGLVDTILTARKRLEMAAVAFNILNREKAAAIERAEKAEELSEKRGERWKDAYAELTTLRARVAELDEQYADKVDGLESDLSSAVDVLYRRGDDEAREWVRLNYPKQYAALKEKEPEHVLYKTGDADAPDAIKDRNGDVVLSLCRNCGKGEIDLHGSCQNQKEPGNDAG